jgi:hypothetical protein
LAACGRGVPLVSAEYKESGLEYTFGILVELEGSDRPACVIETVVIYRQCRRSPSARSCAPNSAALGSRGVAPHICESDEAAGAVRTTLPRQE